MYVIVLPKQIDKKPNQPLLLKKHWCFLKKNNNYFECRENVGDIEMKICQKGSHLSDVKFLSNFMFFSTEKTNFNGAHSQGL